MCSNNPCGSSTLCQGTCNMNKDFNTKFTISTDILGMVEALVEVTGNVRGEVITKTVPVSINSLYVTTQRRNSIIRNIAVEKFKSIVGIKPIINLLGYSNELDMNTNSRSVETKLTSWIGTEGINMLKSTIPSVSYA